MKNGKIKTFLKPSIAKIVIIIILVIVSSILLLTTSWCTMAMTIESSKAQGVCYLGIGAPGTSDILCPNFFTYIFAPIFVIFYGGHVTCSLFILFGGNLIYLYFISCLMILVYERIKSRLKKFKEKKGGKNP